MSGTSISDFQCVCLEVPYSDIENTEREAGFLERRSRVLNIETWCHELNCDPPPKKKIHWRPPAPQNVTIFGETSL